MFTGIVEGQGSVASIAVAPDGDGARLQIAAPWLDGLEVGESIAVSGCCVTVVAVVEGGFAADLVAETLRRTALGGLARGTRVNLERPLAAGGRLGGHIVQGHVDGVGLVRAVHSAGDGRELTVDVGPDLGRYMVEKGSVAVDGVSLTIAAIGPDWFTCALVPHTLDVTTLGARAAGDRVQIEVDVVAKYVERLLDGFVTRRVEGSSS